MCKNPSQTNPPDTPLLLKTSPAADYLGLSRRTLENLRYRGGGPRFIKLGSAVRYRREDLDAWVEAGLQESTASPAGPGPGGA
ncbi:MAG: helix-turn-helix domain-containing protein [Desulfarculaceae bacterium]|nr:helix-turn-helix domain-containing protein [Desulfarculaceae bacterium]